MATNDLRIVYEGVYTTVVSTTADIPDQNFAVATTNATLTEFDNTVNPAVGAVATLYVAGWDTAAPVADSSIDLYEIPQDLGGGTGDVTPPTLTDRQGAKYIGSFSLYNINEAQEQQITISIVGTKKSLYSIQNNSGQAIDFSDGAATVKLERFTYQPEA